MNLKPYKKSLDLFREWYTKKVLDVQKQLGGVGDIPKFSEDELVNIAKSLGSALFYFLDENDIFISICYTKNEGFNYDLTFGVTFSISEKYTKRTDCEYAAIEEGFKILNDK